jgi:hypothetical protein
MNEPSWRHVNDITWYLKLTLGSDWRFREQRKMTMCEWHSMAFEIKNGKGEENAL